MVALGQQNRIYIEDFEIAPEATLTVPVMLSNVDETRGIQFNLTVPQGLKIVSRELSDYAAQERFNMNFSVNKVNDSTWTMIIYPSGRICFPPDEQAMVLVGFKAKAEFKGGDLLLWKCRGSTIDNVTIYINDDTAHVSVPQSSVISVPNDHFTVSEVYYNIMGQPISSHDTVPVAIRVATMSDGTRMIRKEAKK